MEVKVVTIEVTVNGASVVLTEDCPQKVPEKNRFKQNQKLRRTLKI